MVQSLTESVLLALAGATLGTGLTSLTLTSITRQDAFVLPRASEIRLDVVVLAFTLIIAVLTGVLAAVAYRFVFRSPTWYKRCGSVA